MKMMRLYNSEDQAAPETMALLISWAPCLLDVSQIQAPLVRPEHSLVKMLPDLSYTVDDVEMNEMIENV